MIDGEAGELGGEDFFNSGKLVKPGKDFSAAQAIEEALVELLANVVGEAGNFAEKAALEGLFRLLRPRLTSDRFDGESFVVAHAGNLA
jgi:hypothetical protein